MPCIVFSNVIWEKCEPFLRIEFFWPPAAEDCDAEAEPGDESHAAGDLVAPNGITFDSDATRNRRKQIRFGPKVV